VTTKSGVGKNKRNASAVKRRNPAAKRPERLPEPEGKRPGQGRSHALETVFPRTILRVLLVH